MHAVTPFTTRAHLCFMSSETSSTDPSSKTKSNGKVMEVMIETPRGKRNKFKYDSKHDRFLLCSVLPAGASFPYDFGFLPGTKGEDGDPLDVLVLMDESAFPGCVIEARLIGVLEIEQAEDGEKYRNDRL